MNLNEENKHNTKDNTQNGIIKSIGIYFTMTAITSLFLYFLPPSIIMEKDNKLYKDAGKFKPTKKEKPSLKKIIIFSSIFALLPQVLSLVLLGK